MDLDCKCLNSGARSSSSGRKRRPNWRRQQGDAIVSSTSKPCGFFCDKYGGTWRRSIRLELELACLLVTHPSNIKVQCCLTWAKGIIFIRYFYCVVWGHFNSSSVQGLLFYSCRNGWWCGHGHGCCLAAGGGAEWRRLGLTVGHEGEWFYYEGWQFLGVTGSTWFPTSSPLRHGWVGGLDIKCWNPVALSMMHIYCYMLCIDALLWPWPNLDRPVYLLVLDFTILTMFPLWWISIDGHKFSPCWL